MSGAGAIVQIDVEEPLAHERTAIDRLRHLFHREANDGPLPVGHRLAPLLKVDLLDYLEQLFSNPWTATEQITRYIQTVAGHGSCVRREGDGWVLDLAFPGRESNMEISAEVASHWTGVWLSTTLQILERRHLQPAGITARAHTVAVEPARPSFLPIGPFGYARFIPELSHRSPERAFLLDTRALEAEPGLAKALIPYRRLLGSGVCLCQMCSPEFDAGSLADELAGGAFA